MSHNDLDAYTAKHELVACKKILVNKVLTNDAIKESPALIEKIKKISLQLEECMAEINANLYSQSRSVNSSRMALDQFNEHYWRLKPEGATHAIFSPQENLVYWGKSNKADAHHIKDIQYIWTLSHWSDHHQLLTPDSMESAGLNIVKFPRIDKIAIRYDGKVYVQPMPSEYGVIYESLYKQGLEPTPFDAEQGFVHPTTQEFVDAKQASIYAKYIGMLPEDSEVAQLTPAMIA